jgi:hypothetical protein
LHGVVGLDLILDAHDFLNAFPIIILKRSAEIEAASNDLMASWALSSSISIPTQTAAEVVFMQESINRPSPAPMS